MKFRIKERTIEYCIRKARKETQFQKELELRLEHIDEILGSNYNSLEPLYEERQRIQKELDHIFAKKSYAAFIRSRSKWIEEGEKSASYFLNLEKKRQIHNCINKLSDEKGNHYTNDEEILDHCTDYYSDLYDSKFPKQSSIDKYLSKITTLPTLSYDSQKQCEGEITIFECQKAVGLMKNNKAPSSDGLTIEFYKTFWTDIADTLIGSFNESFKLGHLSFSQNISILSLIFKKGNTEKLKNYRPISLTNVDYRILAFTLALRLQNVISTVVSDNQTGYIRKRFIGTNVRAILDICDYIEKNNSSGVLLFLDFEKAFDSVEWPFLISVLKKFNFVAQFIKWIEVLYNNQKICIKNNGHISNLFSIHRGIRQGCPVSALLFILIIEVLAHQLQNNKSLHGVSVKTSNTTTEFKSFQYADDVNLFLQDEYEVHKALKVINDFSDMAGPKLNISKTEGILLGNLRDKAESITINTVKWTQNPVKCLGIYIGNDILKCNHLNWSQRLQKVETELDAWKKRSLTLFGKVAIIRTLSIPKLLYPAHFLSVPSEVIRKANKMFYAFIWKSKDTYFRYI